MEMLQNIQKTTYHTYRIQAFVLHQSQHIQFKHILFTNWQKQNCYFKPLGWIKTIMVVTKQASKFNYQYIIIFTITFEVFHILKEMIQFVNLLLSECLELYKYTYLYKAGLTGVALLETPTELCRWLCARLAYKQILL